MPPTFHDPASDEVAARFRRTRDLTLLLAGMVFGQPINPRVWETRLLKPERPAAARARAKLGYN